MIHSLHTLPFISPSTDMCAMLSTNYLLVSCAPYSLLVTPTMPPALPPLRPRPLLLCTPPPSPIVVSIYRIWTGLTSSSSPSLLFCYAPCASGPSPAVLSTAQIWSGPSRSSKIWPLSPFTTALAPRASTTAPAPTGYAPCSFSPS